MNHKLHALALALSVLALAGCSRMARVYPANDLAGYQVLEAKFTDSGGSGKVEFTAADGEKFVGDYAIVRGGAIGFGSLLGSVNSTATVTGPAGAAFATGTSNYSGSTLAYSVEGKSAGRAVGIGDRGSRLECEFLHDNWSGHGHGVCRTSKGALYQVMF